MMEWNPPITVDPEPDNTTNRRYLRRRIAMERALGAFASGRFTSRVESIRLNIAEWQDWVIESAQQVLAGDPFDCPICALNYHDGDCLPLAERLKPAAQKQRREDGGKQ